VDFLDAKLEARIQPQPKPHLDGIALGYAEFNTWISSQHHKVCSCGFAHGIIPSMDCYEDIDASAGATVQDSSWALAPLALCSYTSRRRYNFFIMNLVVRPTSIMLNAQGSRFIGSYHAPYGLRKVS